MHVGPKLTMESQIVANAEFLIHTCPFLAKFGISYPYQTQTALAQKSYYIPQTETSESTPPPLKHTYIHEN